MGSQECWLVVLFLVILTISEVEAGRDFYKIMGVPRDAGPKQIKKAFRTLSVKYHPDKNKGNREAEEMYMDINAAYETLSDPDKRRQYDQMGEDGMKEQARRGGGGGGFDPFADLFGFGGGRQKRTGGMVDGPSFEAELFVSLADLYNGKELRFLHRKQVLCHKCRGTGAKDPDDVHKCPSCGGSGSKTTTRRLGPGFVQQVQSTCDRCGGKGTISKSKCPHCAATKVEMGAVDHFLIIEKGMPDGHQITFKSQWEESPDTNPGDLIFVIRTHKHPFFVRQKNNLKMKIEISLLESLVGFTREFEHMDGHIFEVSTQKVTIPGQVLIKKGEGMPFHEFSSQKGDLYVEVFVKFPKSLSRAQKEGIERILS